MKRITAAFTALAVIIGLGTSCQKEMENRQETSGSGNGLKVTATIADNGTKVSYQEDGATPNPGLQPSWQANDIIIGFDDAEPSKTYAYKVVSVDEQTKKATLERITDGEETVKGTATSDPADDTKMYMFYAPGTTPDKISSKSLTVSLASQAVDVVPAIMMAQATVANGSLSLSFSNTTAIIGVKAPVMADKNKAYTSLALSGSAGLNTEVKFGLDGETLKASYQTQGALTKELNFTSNSETGKGPDVIYIVACPAEQQDLSFKFNDTEEYFNVENVAIEANNYYRLEAPGTEKQKFTLTAGTTTNGSISFKNGSETITSGSLVAWGTEVTVTATPNEGYELATLTYNDGESHNITDNKFNMPQKDVTVSGGFQKKDFAITAGGTATSGTYTVTGGSYTVQSGNPLADVTTAKIGDVITVTPTPAAGYSGGTVTVKKTGTEDAVDFDATSKTFTMPAAGVTITVTFTHVEYNITGTVTPTSSGTVKFKKSGSEVTKAYHGDVITVEATPATGYELVSITAKDADKADVTVTSGTFTMPAKNVAVTVTFRLASFSVSSDKKVWFAKGNLYAKKNGSTWKWGFYDKQYQFNSLCMPLIPSSGVSRNAASSDTEIDMFCWGYSSNSTNYNDQSINSSFTDWGSISGLPSAPGANWCTLSKDEWTHLLNNRTGISTVNGTANARYLKCKVNDGTRDVYGLIIFPDTFTWPTTVTAPTASYINDNDLAWDSVPGYNQTQFTALEGAGVVFLPAAGYRKYGTSVYYVGNTVYYWSSTEAGDSSKAYGLILSKSQVNPSSSLDRDGGRSVRLVSVVQ